MAVGQAVFTSALDVGALNAVEARLEVRGVEECFRHGLLLRDVLELHRVLRAGGVEVSTVPQLALLLPRSEAAAATLLAEAQLLVSLPGGLEALDCGLLTIAQSAALLRAVGHLDALVQRAVWQRLQARLLAACDGGVVLPPARLSVELARWVLAADPASAEQRRRRAEADGDVTYRRREDGVGDLFATGIAAPLLQAVLQRVRAFAQPFGSQDDRTSGKRRVDALVDLLLGRTSLPLDRAALDRAALDRTALSATESDGDSRPVRHCGRSCGCRSGTPAPCGAEVVVHVPLGAALGITDELAELVGHGPLTPEQLQRLLMNAPRLRAVRVDAQGVPVSVDDRTWTPPRGDAQAVQDVLLHLAGAPPGPVQPRHPFDHSDAQDERDPAWHADVAEPPDPADQDPSEDRSAVDDHSGPDGRGGPGGLGGRVPGGDLRPRAGAGRPRGSFDVADLLGHESLSGTGARPQVRRGAHPTGTPGPYRLPRRLQRLLQIRAPRCEWPGCGARSRRCDMDHDRPWPAGPTCACQCGPLCRRHHRVKQAIMTKQRQERSAVRWTDPTGRSWTSPAQHTAPAAAVRPLPVVAPVQDHPLSPDRLAELLADHDDDPVQFELRAVETDPDDHDRLARQIDDDDGWGLALDDPYRWFLDDPYRWVA